MLRRFRSTLFPALTIFIALMVVTFFAADVSPADAVAYPVPGAAAKPAAFEIRPPWTPGESERITCAYGCGGHQGIANPFASNDYYAMDFGLFRGEAVRAVASGTVTWAGQYPPPSSWSCYGHSVAVNHDGPGQGITSLYAHLDSLSVKAGQTVNAGDLLGYAGGSGGGTNRFCPYPFAPHLHFAMYRGAVTGNHPPYGGRALVPEAFAHCQKADGSPCEDLARGDVLTALAAGPAPTAIVPAPEGRE